MKTSLFCIFTLVMVVSFPGSIYDNILAADKAASKALDTSKNANICTIKSGLSDRVMSPDIPVLISPADGALLDNGRLDTQDKIKLEFDWTDVNGASAYHLYVWHLGSGSSLIDIVISNSRYLFCDNGYILNPSRLSWQWKVRAFKSGGWKPWSGVRKFDVEPLDTDPPYGDQITLNRTNLNFGATPSGGLPPFWVTQDQDLVICIGFCGPYWTAQSSASWLILAPGSGTGSGTITVSVNPVGLSTGTYIAAINIYVYEDPNSTQSVYAAIVNAILKVYGSGQSSPPIGYFDTPSDGSTVRSSIAVTGWALDDIQVESVRIYNGNAFVGDAVFVEGARPDVEQTYPDYPNNYKAGWGYMLLTNFLPNGGNGTYTLYAKAIDVEGQVETLGSKTIHADNANAVKPFGAIDTPTQGGIASGINFINWGWVLTPQPNSIPTDGSTISVWVDGVNIGHPTYNISKPNIATLFPGYANSNGAGGYFFLDTTSYTNGMHTIHWTARDSGGNSDGIGSRYFYIPNLGKCYQNTVVSNQWSVTGKNPNLSMTRIDDTSPARILKGYNKNKEPQKMYPDYEGITTIEIKELERIEVRLGDNNLTVNTQNITQKNISTQRYTGYLILNNQLRSLPIGSSLDSQRGVFYWQPGPGFLGEYRFVFIEKNNNGNLSRRYININIVPKF
jgi:hypothetical protein